MFWVKNSHFDAMSATEVNVVVSVVDIMLKSPVYEYTSKNINTHGYTHTQTRMHTHMQTHTHT